jgi:hypothetical protein
MLMSRRSPRRFDAPVRLFAWLRAESRDREVRSMDSRAVYTRASRPSFVRLVAAVGDTDTHVPPRGVVAPKIVVLFRSAVPDAGRASARDRAAPRSDRELVKERTRATRRSPALSYESRKEGSVVRDGLGARDRRTTGRHAGLDLRACPWVVGIGLEILLEDLLERFHWFAKRRLGHVFGQVLLNVVEQRTQLPKQLLRGRGLVFGIGPVGVESELRTALGIASDRRIQRLEESGIASDRRIRRSKRAASLRIAEFGDRRERHRFGSQNSAFEERTLSVSR